MQYYSIICVIYIYSFTVIVYWKVNIYLPT